jgi:heme exporter protein B
MTPFAAIVRRDLRLAARAGGSILTVVLFFALVATLAPFAVGPDRDLLTRIGPAIIWIAALLALLITSERLWRDDHEDGSLAAMRLARLPLEAIVAGKLIAHWLTTALPLIVVTPALAVLYHLDLATVARIELTLLIGTPALICYVGVGAAVTVALRRGGLIAPVLVLPLAVPTLIFGIAAIRPVLAGSEAAALMFLTGFSLLAIVIAPFAAALALRMGAE